MSGALIVVGLCGCATAPNPVQDPEQLRTTHGFVRVSLPLGEGQTKLVLRPITGGANHELRQQEALGANTFGVWLPAGEYEFPQLANPDGGKYLSVSVGAGQMTELGGLAPIQLGGYEFVILPVQHPEITEDSVRALKHLTPYLKTQQILNWNPTVVPKPSRIESGSTGLGLGFDLLMEYSRHVNKPPLNQQLKQQTSIDALFKLARTALPPQSEEPAVDAKGNLYFGAELGQIRVRAPDGNWSNLDTGTLQAITAVASSGSQLIAGTDQGRLLIGDDGGKHWVEVAKVENGEAIMDIDRLGSGWVVLASRMITPPGPLAEKGLTSLNVYLSPNADLGGLKRLRQHVYPVPVSYRLAWGPKGQVWANNYYIKFDAELLKLDGTSLQWSVLGLPHIATTVNVSRQTGVITATLIKGGFSKLHISTNDGATWQRRDNPPYPIYDVNFDAPDVGSATRWNMGAFSSTIEFMRYESAKDRWQKTHEAPAGCARILRDAFNVQRYCLTSGGSILNFVDGKWVVEFAAN